MRNCFLFSALLLLPVIWSPIPVAQGQEVKKVPAEQVFDGLVKPPQSGMTQQEAEKYLEQYDPRYSDPRLAAYAKKHPEFREFMRKNIAADAAELISNNGVQIRGQQVITKDQFVKLSTTPPATLTKTPPPDYLSKLTGGALKDSNLSITKSTTIQGDEKRPAQFSWTRDSTGSYFTIDGAMNYKFNNIPPLLLGNYGIEPIIIPSIEAHTSSQSISKRQEDSLSAKLPIELDLAPLETGSDVWFQGHTFVITPDYERDRKKATQSYGVNIEYSPTLARPLQTGQFIPLGAILNSMGISGYSHNYPGFIWRPYVGFENGYVSLSGTSSLPTLAAYGKQDYSRFVFTLHADVYLTPSFDIAVDFSHRTFLTGSDRSFDYVEVSPVLFLDGTRDDPTTQHFSIGMTFKDGKTTPQFKDVQSASVWLGVKF